MIRIFSRIRRNLLSERKVGKFIGYALGEIVLVVVGILIALQINDWAEDRRTRNFELKTLAQIHKNLQQDHAKLELIRNNRRTALQSIDSILAINDPNDQIDDLQYWLADVIQFDRFHSITNAYDVLKSRGLDIVQNDQLRLDLGIYYDGWTREILEHNKDLERSFFDVWMPMLHSDFDAFEWREVAKPLDQSAFLGNRLVLNALRLERDNHQGAAENIDRMMAVNVRLQQLIEDDIND